MIDLREHGGPFGGSKGGALNVYVQPDEPSKKDGIWVKADTKFNELSIDTTLFSDVSDLTEINTIQETFFISIVSHKGVHLMGVEDDTGVHYLYNPDTNKITELPNHPLKSINSSDAANASTIYLNGHVYYFGEDRRNRNEVYRYDVDNQIWLHIATAPETLRNTQSFTDGTNIYLVGGASKSEQVKVRRFNLNANTFTQLEDSPEPYTADNRSNSNFYTLTGKAYNGWCIFDMLTETWSRPRNGEDYRVYLPDNQQMAKINNFILHMNPNSLYVNSLEFFTQETYRLTQSLGRNYKLLSSYKNSLYLFETLRTETKVYKIDFYPNHTKEYALHLLKKGDAIQSFQTALIKPMVETLGDGGKLLSEELAIAQLFYDGVFQDHVFYYGDGKKWIRGI